MEPTTYPIALVNMPFARINRPSIALAQLKSVLKTRFEEKVDPHVHYLNHDFAEFLGTEVFNDISNSFLSVVSGLGDWMFTAIAFPDASDHTEEYFRRHPRILYARSEWMEKALVDKRNQLPDFLDGLIDRYELDGCRMVGLTSMFQQNVPSMALAKRLKDRDPSIVTVMGGANCEGLMGQALIKNFQPLDFTFSGPGLMSFPQFVGHILEGETDQCHQIKGIYSRQKLGSKYKPDEIGAELPLHVPVELDYDDYLEDLESRRERFPVDKDEIRLLFETSRGCWWGERLQCTFCGLNGSTMNYRAMPPEMALKQFEKLFRYSSRVGVFECVDNIMPKEYLTEVFPHVRSPKPMFYEVKADLKDHDFDVLAQAGVVALQPGIEALTTPTLKLMKKGTTAFQNVRFLKNCSRTGISPVWGLLLGFPGQKEECYEKLERDLPLMYHLPPPLAAIAIRFERFSPYFDLAKEYNLNLTTPDCYRLIYPFPDEDLHNLAYFFKDQNFDATYLQLAAKWIPRIQKLVVEWHARRSQKDGKLKPELRFHVTELSRLVRDTRTGTLVEIELDENAFRILQALTTQSTSASLGRMLPDIGLNEIEETIGRLRQHSLLFEEGNLMMSLVGEAIKVQQSQAKAAVMI